jgi:hypothetical protein
MTGLSKLRETFHLHRPARRRSLSPAVEALDQRALLSAGLSYPVAGHAAQIGREHDIEHNGTVVQSPLFYEDYVGPQLAQLNAVGATGRLLHDGSFRFLGVNQGAIDPNMRATYVFGVDRNGNLPTGPFPDRPDIRFDATVVIKIVPGQATTVTVTDLANKTSSILPGSALRISGRKVEVTLPGSLLPSTGLAPSQFRYNYWPEDGLPGSTNIASFAPENHDIRVGDEQPTLSRTDHRG